MYVNIVSGTFKEAYTAGGGTGREPISWGESKGQPPPKSRAHLPPPSFTESRAIESWLILVYCAYHYQHIQFSHVLQRQFEV